MPGDHQRQPQSAGGMEGYNRTHDTARPQPYVRPKDQLDSGWIPARLTASRTTADKEDPTSYIGGSSPDTVKSPEHLTHREQQGEGSA